MAASVGGSKVRLGDMLVTAELISAAQLDEALQAQRASGVPLGKQLVELGYVTEVQVTQTLSNQLSVPWVSIARIEFSAQLLNRVPGEIADQYTVMPIYVRSVRGQGDTLYVAMDDPTDRAGLEAVSRAAGLPVRPMVAPPSDIRVAIERRYFGAADSLPPTARAARAPTASSPPGAPIAGAANGQGAEPSASQSGGGSYAAEVPLDQYAKPSDRPKAAPTPASSRTLTFLDGTTVALPAAGRASNAASEIREVRHLVKSIIAAQKAGPGGGPPRWEEVVQVLIDLMRDRGVSVTRREFAQAWLRSRGS